MPGPTALSRDARMTLGTLATLIVEQDRLGDISKMVLSVTRPGFKIMFVPNGREDIAKMELNER